MSKESEESIELDELYKSIALQQAKNGDVKEAMKAAISIKDAYFKSQALGYVAKAQAENGDFIDAKKTAESIENHYFKRGALRDISAKAETLFIDEFVNAFKKNVFNIEKIESLKKIRQEYELKLKEFFGF